MATVDLNFWQQHLWVDFRKDKSEPWEAGCCWHRAGSPSLWATHSGGALAVLSGRQENLLSPFWNTARSFFSFYSGVFQKIPLLLWGSGLSIKPRLCQILLSILQGELLSQSLSMCPCVPHCGTLAWFWAYRTIAWGYPMWAHNKR